jgi:hypothetical protein
MNPLLGGCNRAILIDLIQISSGFLWGSGSRHSRSWLQARYRFDLAQVRFDGPDDIIQNFVRSSVIQAISLFFTNG